MSQKPLANLLFTANGVVVARKSELEWLAACYLKLREQTDPAEIKLYNELIELSRERVRLLDKILESLRE